MPEKPALQRARQDAAEGKSPATQAGEFVREEIRIIRKGTHGARSAKQAIAIGLSKARRAGVALPVPAKGKASPEVRRKAAQDLELARDGHSSSPTRSRARIEALKKESGRAASPQALARQGRAAAKKRGQASLRQAARKAARTRRTRRG